jgi:hypothetical protein
MGVKYEYPAGMSDRDKQLFRRRARTRAKAEGTYVSRNTSSPSSKKSYKPKRDINLAQLGFRTGSGETSIRCPLCGVLWGTWGINQVRGAIITRSLGDGSYDFIHRDCKSLADNI